MLTDTQVCGAKRSDRPQKLIDARGLYLLERMGHSRQTKTAVLLDPSVKPLLEGLDAPHEKESKWMPIINEVVEVDS